MFKGAKEVKEVEAGKEGAFFLRDEGQGGKTEGAARKQDTSV